MAQIYQAIKTQDRMQSWMGLISAQKKSGLSVKKWCRENGVSEGTYYYWLNKLRAAALQEMTEPVLTEIDVRSAAEADPSPVAQIRKGGAEVTVFSGITEGQLKAIVSVL